MIRPLDPLRSIKAKLGVVIVVATAAGVAIVATGSRFDIAHSSILGKIVGAIVGVAFALILVQVLSRGMTSPLREMASAAKAMASGDYTKRVRATSRDEVGQLAQAFNAMASDLAETDRVRRDLVANVSHELRTPISGLQAALENIIDGASKPDEEVFRTMLSQTERLGRLVAELLDLSRLESGAIQLQPAATALQPLIEECAEEVALAYPSIGFEFDILPVDIEVFVDPERWRQVVINLLANAAKAAPAESSVSVRVRDERDAVQMEVCDSGPGIPEGERKRVFERFYRADAARSGEGGAGLGLAIVKWIVDLHGGNVVAESNSPHGCRMVVVAPKRWRG